MVAGFSISDVGGTNLVACFEDAQETALRQLIQTSLPFSEMTPPLVLLPSTERKRPDLVSWKRGFHYNLVS